ncbi:endonuclease/exonuclease/phosphatase family protein [Geodermatophilus sp. SYSU D00697]
MAAGPVRVATWNVWWRFGDRWRERQDALLRTLRAVDAAVLAGDPVDGVAPSDHRAVVCYLRWADGP